MQSINRQTGLKISQSEGFQQTQAECTYHFVLLQTMSTVKLLAMLLSFNYINYPAITTCKSLKDAIEILGPIDKLKLSFILEESRTRVQPLISKVAKILFVLAKQNLDLKVDKFKAIQSHIIVSKDTIPIGFQRFEDTSYNEQPTTFPKNLMSTTLNTVR